VSFKDDFEDVMVRLIGGETGSAWTVTLIRHGLLIWPVLDSTQTDLEGEVMLFDRDDNGGLPLRL